MLTRHGHIVEGGYRSGDDRRSSHRGRETAPVLGSRWTIIGLIRRAALNSPRSRAESNRGLLDVIREGHQAENGRCCRVKRLGRRTWCAPASHNGTVISVNAFTIPQASGTVIIHYRSAFIHSCVLGWTRRGEGVNRHRIGRGDCHGPPLRASVRRNPPEFPARWHRLRVANDCPRVWLRR